MASLAFVVSSLEAIAVSKEAQRQKHLADAAAAALSAIRDQHPSLPDPELIFAPLQLATKSGNIQLTTTALDCIGKLISFSFFATSSAQAAASEGGEDEESAAAGDDDGTERRRQPQPAASTAPSPLIERALDTICDCFHGETTAIEVQLQIVKSLLTAVLNDKIVVHGAGLLKAVRQVYNVFLLSRSASNQQVAQGTLAQMVGTVFERVKARLHMREARVHLSHLKIGGGSGGGGSTVTVEASASDSLNGADDESPTATAAPSGGDSTPTSLGGGGAAIGEGKLTLKDLENRKSFDDSNLGDGPTTVTQLRPAAASASAAAAAAAGGRSNPAQPPDSSDPRAADPDGDALDAEDEVYVRDAYLVFRSFCNLSTKILPPDQLYDTRGQAMRSKLLSLHLIQTLLNNHLHVFTAPHCTIRHSKTGEPTSFLQAVKYYICLSISRNGASSVDRIFEVCCEIFWLMLKFLRASFKKEIEVFLNEIYLALLARRSAPVSQKAYLVSILARLCADPRALVEMYINYDCDRAVDNIFQTVIEDLSKFATSPVMILVGHEQMYEERAIKTPVPTDWQIKPILPPPLSAAHIVPAQDNAEGEIPKEYILKRTALDALVESLRSLVNWSAALPRSEERQAAQPRDRPPGENDSKGSVDDIRPSADAPFDPSSVGGTPRIGTPQPPAGGSHDPDNDDSIDQLEREKARKSALDRAIRLFNFKPKRGLKLLLQEGFIPSDSATDIARFFLAEPRLDKAELGKFMGESAPENIAIMHAFVDSMEFSKRRFVDALRQFLQSFRLPGEAQIVDRYMLKFANRYHEHNPNAFANADTAYILAYSVILLNTDLHSVKVAKRMTKDEFVRNNRGVNDNADLPEEYLHGIYDEIARNEIVLTSERESVAAAGGGSAGQQQQQQQQQQQGQQQTGFGTGLGQALSNVGRDLQREAYLHQSEEMALRSEQLFRTLFRNQRRNPSKHRSRHVAATSTRHVGPMFDVTWMAYFSTLSGLLQKTHSLEVSKICLEGMKLATQITCLFRLPIAREAFVSALRNTTNLNSPREMAAKNVEALKVLLELGQTEGSLLRESWKDILLCISQLDRLQLISGGVDESAVPDVSKARFLPPPPPPPLRTDTIDSTRSSMSSSSQATGRRPRARSGGGTGGGGGGIPHSSPAAVGYSAEIALSSRSDEVVKAVDRIFTGTANLTGDGMVHFARALAEVSWDEIKVSGSLSDSPRTYSLQKMVEISYYNMTRVRFEWTVIWDVLGDHFNRVGCHPNTTIAFFALDSLRQLSMRFMEIEELPGFKFQKDFLKPFEHVMLASSGSAAVKDMVLRCLVQMIQARGDNIRSGWRTMFGAFTAAARETNESIVALAYENVCHVYRTRFGVVIAQGAFTDLIVCLTEFGKNLRFQKKSLQALETLKSIIPRMLKTAECPLSQQHNGKTTAPALALALATDSGHDGQNAQQQPGRIAAAAAAAAAAPSSAGAGATAAAATTTTTSVEEGFWFPILFAFHDVLMTGEDLEVRSSALEYFFDALLRHGSDFSPEFWDILWRQQLYPIFMVLRSRPELSSALSHEELSVWLSTTMIQALRNMITLFTHYFDALEWMLDRFLDLLTLCICQENDTISRIGSNCLQQLVLRNVTRFTSAHWAKIVGAFCELFERTTARQLFSATAISSTTTSSSLSLSPPPARAKFGTPADDDDNDDYDDDKSLRINGTAGNGALSGISPENGRHGDERRGGGDEDGGGGGDGTPTMAMATAPLEDYRPHNTLQPQPVVVSAARKRFFNRIIYRCVLQLLMIETVGELFSSDAVYAQIPSSELLRLMTLLRRSYRFAREFNNNLELRMSLLREGFMGQLPNLLKQESGSSATYVSILFRMFADKAPDRAESRPTVEKALVSLCCDIISGYVSLDEESQHRNVLAWRPVVVEVLEGYASFPVDAFSDHVPDFYPLLVDLLGKDLSPELRAALLAVFRRVGEVRLKIESRGNAQAGGSGRDGGDLPPRRDSLVGGVSPSSPVGVGRTGREDGDEEEADAADLIPRGGM